MDEFLGEFSKLGIEYGVGDFEGAGTYRFERDFKLLVVSQVGDEGNDNYKLSLFQCGLAHEVDFSIFQTELGIAELLGEFGPAFVDEFSGIVKAEQLVDQFWATVPAGSKNKHVMTAAARLWICLPDEVRKQLIDAESVASPKKRQDSFIAAVRRIARAEFRKLQGKEK